MFRLESEIDKDRGALIEQRLTESNTARSAAIRGLCGTPAEDEVPLHVFAVDDSGALAGGLVGHTWAHWLHVDLLWIEKSQRGQGLGTRLMSRAEEIARDERRCLHARVETWDFQAPGFYQKLGYRIVGVVEDYPPGVIDHLLVKPLTGG